MTTWRYESRTTKPPELIFSAIVDDNGTRDVRFEGALHLMRSRKLYIYAAPEHLVITYLTPMSRILTTRET